MAIRDSEGICRDCAIAAAHLIVEALRDTDTTDEELLSIVVLVVSEAIGTAERLLGGFQAVPSEN